jgi:RNA polymerase sigma factor (TIGR02999 family)
LYPERISNLLEQAQQGDQTAEHQLIELVYEELRIMAHHHLRREYGAMTLSTTALVNEAYVKLVDSKQPPFRGRAYFFGAAARAMRQVIVDLARLKMSQKRGAGQRQLTLNVDEVAVDACAAELLELDSALQDLALHDARLANIVECRFFGGLTEQQTSDFVGVTARTVRRDWRKARAWLYTQLNVEADTPTGARQPAV